MSKKSSKGDELPIWGEVSFVLFTVGIAIFAVIVAPHPRRWTDVFQIFGDFAGPLFSMLALLLLIRTLQLQRNAVELQRDDLELNRQELRETREELRRTADAQAASERALAAQVKTANQSARLAATRAMLEHLEWKKARLPDIRLAGNNQEHEQIDKMIDNALVLITQAAEEISESAKQHENI